MNAPLMVFKLLEEVKIKEGTVVEVHLPCEQEPVSHKHSIKGLPFFGMWNDRTDIEDGLSYVNNVRDKPTGVACLRAFEQGLAGAP